MTTSLQAAGGMGSPGSVLTSGDVTRICQEAVENWEIDGKRLLFVVPDHTRSCPLDQVFKTLYPLVADRCSRMSFLIALGTHPPMSQDAIYHRFGISAEEHRQLYPKAEFFNHLWRDPDELIDLGTIPSSAINDVTNGLFEMDVKITCNRLITEHDTAIVIGPVFPHEVVGFSGGNKYFFPGISGQEIIDFFHWLGAILTNPVIIGNKWTAVRKVVDLAATMMNIERRALCMVVKGQDLAGLYYGTPEEAWSSAADLSSSIHVQFYDQPFHTVLSCAPRMYDDLWTGGKCMYKIEPVVSDGGKVIIYAPHITEVSETHGDIINEIGYHTRDYFLENWDRFKSYPWGVVAHSTHVRGIGEMIAGVEHPRVDVILATSMSEAACKKINMGYMDYREINVEDYANREDEGILYVPKAGEILYRWKNAPARLGGPA
jgi:nickel-dependent lactate racemase